MRGLKHDIADKIITLRKRNGWSQEELAEQLGISRQSVSKWESGGSIPDLDKIIRMSSLFGVSTDYLLKEEIEELTGGIGMVVLLLMIVVAVGIFVLNGIHYS